MQNLISIKSSSDFIKVSISNSRTDSISFEKSFSKSLTVAELKRKLEVITGASATSMKLELYNADRLISKIDNDETLIGSLPFDSGTRLHVTDNFAWLSDEAIEKFELSDDQYDKKESTLRSFLRTNRLGKYNNEDLNEVNTKHLADEELQKTRLFVNARCQVKVKNNPTRRGTIMYNGFIEGKNGIFIGVKYDEPLGKNNGSINGKQYFECQSNYGGFVPPSAVEVGDFPPEDTELNDEL